MALQPLVVLAAFSVGKTPWMGDWPVAKKAIIDFRKQAKTHNKKGPEEQTKTTIIRSTHQNDI
jgi:hypothetical protein